jgi:hypothetical protein
LVGDVEDEYKHNDECDIFYNYDEWEIQDFKRKRLSTETTITRDELLILWKDISGVVKNIIV